MKPHAEYFDKAESWATNTQLLTLRSRRAGWAVSAVAVGIIALQALALAMLAPLKTVQPITLLVDRQTGFVQAVDPDTPRRVGADEMLTQSFLAQYVAAREGFDRATVAADYRKVALLSAGAARTNYLAQMPAASPASPFRRFSAGTVVAARVKSVSSLGPDTALVRFDTEQHDSNGGVVVAQPWISVIRFAYSDTPMSLEDRLVNPLGFKVLSYRRSAEAPLEPKPPVQAVAAEPIGYEARAARPGELVAAPVARIGDRIVELGRIPSGSPLADGRQ